MKIDAGLTLFRSKNANKLGDVQTQSDVTPNIKNKTPFLAVANASAVSFTANDYKTEQIFKVPEYGTNGYVFKLKNNQRVIVVPKPGPVMISTVAKVGAMNEPLELSGISHFIEHSMFNGSRNLKPKEFDTIVNKHGADTNAMTSYNATQYYILSGNNSANALEEFVKTHAEFIQYPSFSPEMVKQEKEPVIKEIEQYIDDSQDMIDIQGHNELLGLDINYEKILGSKDHIRSLKPEDLHSYYEKWYDPSNLTTIIIGNVKPQDVAKLSAKYFDKPSKRQDKEIYETPMTYATTGVTKHFESAKFDYPAVSIKLLGPKSNDIKEVTAANILMMCLSGYLSARLDSKLEEELGVEINTGMANISSNPQSPLEIGFDCSFPDEKSQKKGLSIINEVLKGLESNPISEQELKIAKDKLLDEFNKSSETTEGLETLILDAVVNHHDMRFYTEAEKLINSVTVEDVNNIAKKYLQLDKAVTVIANPTKKSKKDASFTSSKIINFTGAKTKELFGTTKEKNLDNNAHLIISDSKNNIRNSAVISYGFHNDRVEKPGLINILQEILSSGTSKMSKSEFNKFLDENCIELNPIVSNNQIRFIVSAKNQENFIKGVNLSQEIIQDIKLDKDTFDKAVKSFAAKISTEEYEACDRAEEAMFKTTPAKNTLRKIKSEYKKVKLEEVIDFYNRVTKNPYLTTSIAVNTAKTPTIVPELSSVLEKTPFDIKSYNREIADFGKDIKEPLVIAESRDELEQASVVQSYKINTKLSLKELQALRALNYILGEGLTSRLFMDLREKQGLAYSVGSSVVIKPDKRYVELSIATTTEESDGKGGVKLKPDNIKKSLAGFKRNIDSLMRKPVSEEELQMAKRTLISNMNFIEASQKRAEELYKYYEVTGDLNYQDKQIMAINEISVEDIQSVARKVFSVNPVTSIQAGPDTVDAIDDYLKTIGKVSRCTYKE